MEIQLSSKRKLGFVTGSEERSVIDATDAVQWDTCNNMVISWLHNNVSESIKKSILFVNSASEVWKLLEKRFQVSNGSRKYKLNRELFNLKQNGSTLVEYFTALSSIWEEIDDMNALPVFINLTNEIRAFPKALDVQKQESKLFQFLNGLDDAYNAQRSQILMMSPLPTVEIATSMIQQEESQRDILKQSQGPEIAVMYSKSNVNADKICSECGGKGHIRESCWTVIGYPKWHSKYKKSTKGTVIASGKWNKNSGHRAANAVMKADEDEEHDQQIGNENVVLSSKQFEQLLKMLPVKRDELESPFSGMVMLCNNVEKNVDEWIVDSGATDHMTSQLDILTNIKLAASQMKIKLPTGDTAVISHIGDVELSNGLKLIGVLYVPTFNHNLLSIHKLAHDNACQVMFTPEKCLVIGNQTREVQGIGYLRDGLYY